MPPPRPQLIHHVGAAAVPTDPPSVGDRSVRRAPRPASTVIAPVARPDCGSSENRLRSVGDRSDRLASRFNRRAVCRTIHRPPAWRLVSSTGHGTDAGPKSSPM